jgi:hypothetical protein
MPREFVCAGPGCGALVFSFVSDESEPPTCLECRWLAKYPDDADLRALLRPHAPANDDAPAPAPEPVR